MMSEAEYVCDHCGEPAVVVTAGGTLLCRICLSDIPDEELIFILEAEE